MAFRSFLLALYNNWCYFAIEEVTIVLFHRYTDVGYFKAEMLDALLENEVQNNLIISIILENKARYASDWLMAAVTDQRKAILVALYTKPFNLLLYEAESGRQDAVELMAQEIRRIGALPPGVLAERGLARRFAGAYCADWDKMPQLSMTLMRLDRLAEYEKAPGHCRTLEERDMFFTPYWERAFSEDCRVHVFSLPENVERIRTRLGKDTHYIWEDGTPVSQAVYGRETPNGAVINWVYTPPHIRGHGYATSVVAELSRDLLDRGKRFCCLFADADNPVSCELYHKLGYYDVCAFEEIRFDTGRKV